MKWFFPFVLTAIMLAGPFALHSHAGQREGVNLALVPSAQLFSENSEVTGMRLNVVGSNLAMKGLDLGIVNLSQERFTGAAIGIGNGVEGLGIGLQLGLFNYAGEFHGLQCGLFNQASKLEGVQLGFANYSHDNNLLQLGVVNVANNHIGWQIGLMNFNTRPAASFPGMIFVNGSF
ncbi:MAG: hypothetical protein O3C57_01815 [Verrucomicrobia bacterium]|nr:hypothetical protein [Verrucomicrobiota bacterium]